MGLTFASSGVLGPSIWSWGEVFILGGFLLAYGFLLVGVFLLFWRWSCLSTYQTLVSALRQGRGVFWQRLTLFFLICFSGLPPAFFFFNKLGLLIYVFQFASFFRVILLVFFYLQVGTRILLLSGG